MDLLDDVVQLPYKEMQSLLLLHALACPLLPAVRAQLVGQAGDRDLELEVCSFELHVLGSQGNEVVLDVPQLPSEVSVVPVQCKVCLRGGSGEPTKSKRVTPGSAPSLSLSRVSRPIFAASHPPHEITVPVYDFLVLVDVLPPELLERVEEGLTAWPGRRDHPAHPAGGAGHGYGCDVISFPLFCQFTSLSRCSSYYSFCNASPA